MSMVAEGCLPAVVITGTVGVGKTTVMGAISEVLEGQGIRDAAIDQDALRCVHPQPDGDRFGSRLGLRNLAAIWPNLREVGLGCVLVADVVEDPNQSAQYEEAMPGTTATVVRLVVPMPLILKRLEGRETGESLAWSQHRAPELHGIQERAGVGDVVIHVGERSPAEVSEEILQRMYKMGQLISKE